LSYTSRAAISSILIALRGMGCKQRRSPAASGFQEIRGKNSGGRPICLLMKPE